MKIAVSGCGIAGTMVSALLAKAGHEVTIFEQAEECRSVGAGIMLQPSGQRVLQRFGLLDQIECVSSRLVGMQAVHPNRRTLVKLRYSDLDPDLYGLGVHRGELFFMLLQQCRDIGVNICNHCQIADYRALSHSCEVELNSGDVHGGFDFLIAADGSRSRLRKAAGIPFKIIEYDYGTFWTTGECDSVTDQLFQVVKGTHYLTGLLPIGKGRCSYFWGLPIGDYEVHEWSSQEVIEGWKQQALKFFPESSAIVEPIQAQELTFASYRHATMKRSYGDRIIFLGDAGHATSPHLGQGVNLALEDAELFASLLISTNDFQTSCVEFETQRRRLIRYYQSVTRLLTPFFQSRGQVLGWGRDIALPWFPRIPLVRRQMLRTLSGLKTGWLG